MHEVQIDVEDGRPTVRLGDEVGVPDLLEQRLFRRHKQAQPNRQDTDLDRTSLVFHTAHRRASRQARALVSVKDRLDLRCP